MGVPAPVRWLSRWDGLIAIVGDGSDTSDGGPLGLPLAQTLSHSRDLLIYAAGRRIATHSSRFLTLRGT